MRPKIFLTFAFIYFSLLSYAQKQDYNWCFGDSCGISFNDSSATFFVTALSFDSSYLTNLESCASISDSSGNLLFYTSGSQVWNKYHHLMPNGIGLYEQNTITQGVLILPKPDDASRYYIFHLSYIDPPGFYYSIVNMTLDSGRGDIELNHKNIRLDSTTMNEKLAAVRHANGRDWWVAHKEGGTSNYYVYLLSSDTIILTGIQNPGGYVINLVDASEMNFSPQGDRLAAVTSKGQINLFDFDRCAGIISDFIDLSDPDSLFFWSSSYSSDGSKLYVSSTTKLFQFDLNDANILQSKLLIWNNPYGDSLSEAFGFNLVQHQLAPNGKIYITLCANFPMDTFLDESLCVINKPNEEGLACDFEPLSFYLGGQHTTFGLPNLPNYNLGRLIGSPCDTLFNNVESVCSLKDEITIVPNPATDFVQIQLKNLQEESYKLLIYDLTGFLIESHVLTSTYSKIPIKTLRGGTYIVNIVIKGRVISRGTLLKF